MYCVVAMQRYPSSTAFSDRDRDKRAAVLGRKVSYVLFVVVHESFRSSSTLIATVVSPVL